MDTSLGPFVRMKFLEHLCQVRGVSFNSQTQSLRLRHESEDSILSRLHDEMLLLFS